MSKLTIAKFAVNLIVGAGVSKVTSDIISNNANIDSTEDQIRTAIGSVVIGAIVVDHAKDFTGEKIDDFVESWQEAKARKAKMKAQKKEEKKATEK